MSFDIETTDAEYSYTAVTGQDVISNWTIKNNNKTSETQGYLIKVEKGDTRSEAIVSLTDTKTNLESNVLPMLTYPTNVSVTFDRNIPGRSTSSGTFAFSDYVIKQEFPNDEQEIEIKLIEVIS